MPSGALRLLVGARLRALARYDFLPGFSAVVRRLLYNPLGVLLLAALVSLLCGFFLHTQGFVLCGGILALVVVGVAWPWLSARGLQGCLTFDRARASEGEPVGVCLTLRNRMPWPAWGLAVCDGVTHRPQEQGPVAGIVSVPGRRIARCVWERRPPCRGEYPRSHAWLNTGFPFGLWQSKRNLTVTAPLLVWPRTFPVGPAPMVMGEQQVEGTISRNKVGSSGDVLSLRPYRRGDSTRRIHWRQSARQDRLIVCELQAHARPIVQLILDADPRAHVGEGTDGSWEWAIRIVASLAKGWIEAGLQVGGAWSDQTIAAAAGQSQSRRLLDSLARLEATGSSLMETLALPGCSGFREGLQVIVTTDLALAGADRLIRGEDQQRWVVLRTAGFQGSPEQSPGPAELPLRPWLLVDAVERVPSLLLGGWQEARHGS